MKYFYNPPLREYPLPLGYDIIESINKFMMQDPQVPQNDNPPTLQYQQCQHCSRSFFKGKLKYHLKLCNSDNPMIISPKKTARDSSLKSPSQQRSVIFGKQQKICDFCQAKLPLFLFQKHAERCKGKETRLQVEEGGQQSNKKSSTDMNFKQKQDCSLPAIKQTARHPNTKHSIIKEVYQVKLREELSCFRKAQEIKQIQCPTCQRIFSKEASLRHIPICQTLKKNQELSIALKKRKVSKSMVEQQSSRRTKRILFQKPDKSSLSMLVNPQNPAK